MWFAKGSGWLVGSVDVEVHVGLEGPRKGRGRGRGHLGVFVCVYVYVYNLINNHQLISRPCSCSSLRGDIVAFMNKVVKRVPRCPISLS